MKSPLIRRLIIGAQCLRMSIRAHRAPIIKPPSERQFDAPRQKLASLVSRLLKKGLCPFRRLALPISPIPQTIKDSVVYFRLLCFFYPQKSLRAFCCNFNFEGARGARASRKGLSNCRQNGGFGEKLRWRAYLAYVPIAVSSPKRRLGGSFTSPTRPVRCRSTCWSGLGRPSR